MRWLMNDLNAWSSLHLPALKDGMLVGISLGQTLFHKVKGGGEDEEKKGKVWPKALKHLRTLTWNRVDKHLHDIFIYTVQQV